MKLLIDESIDKQIVDLLKSESYDLIYISETYPGIDDNKVFEIANLHNAILITADKDFGELVFRLKKVSAGIILTRLAGIPSVDKAKIVLSVLKTHSNELIKSFTVINTSSIRIRHQ